MYDKEVFLYKTMAWSVKYNNITKLQGMTKHMQTDRSGIG